MNQYIDGFIFPIARKNLAAYQKVATQVAHIWKEYGALSYFEYVGQDMYLEGTQSFAEVTNAQPDEVVIFGWTTFPSKAVRDEANAKVPNDQRMHDLVGPLVDPSNMIFDASRMVYGGFESLTHVS
ncbi:ybaA [Symbiodinium sp. KB8]|nr:ybaA [Symbiodinium sp. KB8]